MPMPNGFPALKARLAMLARRRERDPERVPANQPMTALRNFRPRKTRTPFGGMR